MISSYSFPMSEPEKVERVEGDYSIGQWTWINLVDGAVTVEPVELLHADLLTHTEAWYWRALMWGGE